MLTDPFFYIALLESIGYILLAYMGYKVAKPIIRMNKMQAKMKSTSTLRERLKQR